MKMNLHVVQIFCVFWTCARCFGTSSYSLPHYTVSPSSGPLTNILIDNSGHMFVSGKNILLKFTADLVLQENISTRGSLNCSESRCEDNFASIFLLYPDQRNTQDTHILFCGTADYGNCSLYNTRNITKVIKLNHYPDSPVAYDHYLGSQTSASAVVVPVIRYGKNKTIIFSAMDYDGRDMEKFPGVFSVRGIYEDEKEIIYDSNPANYISLNNNLYNISMFNFEYGFSFGGYSYFLRNRKYKVPHAQISEVCSNDINYRSYVESELSCGGYALIESAYLLNYGDGTAMLYVAFSSSKHRGSVLCYYEISELREAFRRIQSDCFYRGIGSAPDWVSGDQVACQDKQPPETDFTCGREHTNKRIAAVSPIEMHGLGKDDNVMTSLVAASENGTTAFYCGFKDGVLKKFVQVDFKIMTLFSIQVTRRGQVNDNMVLDPRNRQLYFTYNNTVSFLRVDNCSLHSSCVSCLSDTMACKWCPASASAGLCLAGNQTCNGSRTSYCDAEIHSVAPLSGPLAGGTLVTLEGIFGNPSVSVYRASVGQECILNTTSQSRITCVTPAVSDFQDVDIVLNITYTGTPERLRPTPVLGRAVFGSRFLYRDPRVIKVEPKRVSSIGRPIMTITGEYLDIGNDHRCDVGRYACDVLSITPSELTVAPKNVTRSEGPTSLAYYIDNATVSSSIEIIKPPIIENIVPNKTIKSGGVTLTVKGTWLDGMGKFVHASFLCNGVSCEVNATNVSPGCRIINETVMFCRAPPVNTANIPTTAQFDVKNHFGIISLTGNLTLEILEDPVISNFTPSILTNELTHIHIMGHGFERVNPREMLVTIGLVTCPISKVSDDQIICDLEIPTNVSFHNEVVKVQIGNIIGNVGNVVYQKPIKKPTPTEPAQQYAIASGTDMGVVIVSIIGGVVGVTLLVTLGLKRLRLGPFKRQRQEHYNVVFRNGGSDVLTLDGLSENHVTDVSQSRLNAYQEQTFLKQETYANCTESLLPVVDDDIKLSLERQLLLIDRDCMILGEIIGQGHFGCVYKGYLQTPGEKGEQIVAAKTLHRKNPKDLDINMFLKEALIMKDFHHCHVMKLIGICIGQDQLPLVILPFMENGDLLTYLRDPKNVPTVKELVTFGVDIANGMCYLAELKFVHRDLAARNCMMGDNYRVKVADFGLSRDVYEKEYYSSCDKTTKLPVKWMAPESLEFGIYSSKSDVWSYGVVLWELLTRGVNPYPEVDNWDILRYLKSGRRMSQPSFCPEEMYSIMQRCWSWETCDRPSFGELTEEIPAMIRQLEHPTGERGNKINIETTYVNFGNN